MKQFIFLLQTFSQIPVLSSDYSHKLYLHAIHFYLSSKISLFSKISLLHQLNKFHFSRSNSELIPVDANLDRIDFSSTFGELSDNDLHAMKPSELIQALRSLGDLYILQSSMQIQEKGIASPVKRLNRKIIFKLSRPPALNQLKLFELIEILNIFKGSSLRTTFALKQRVRHLLWHLYYRFNWNDLDMHSLGAIYSALAPLISGVEFHIENVDSIDNFKIQKHQDQIISMFRSVESALLQKSRSARFYSVRGSLGRVLFLDQRNPISFEEPFEVDSLLKDSLQRSDQRVTTQYATNLLSLLRREYLRSLSAPHSDRPNKTIKDNLLLQHICDRVIQRRLSTNRLTGIIKNIQVSFFFFLFSFTSL